MVAAPLAKRAEYAGEIYNGYAASAADEASFHLTVASQGMLTDLLDMPFAASDDGFVTTPHAFENVPNNSVADFEAIGSPLAEGNYRILDVTSTVGRDVSSHKAVEFCWESQFHCVLLAPDIALHLPIPLRQMNDAALQSRDHGFGTVLRIELVHDRIDMAFDRTQ